MILKAENIKKSYYNREILHGVNLEVEEGEFISIMGESGSGKSTLLNILAGNLKADEGEVLIDGKNLTAAKAKDMATLRRTTLGFVFQSLNLIPTLNAKDNIMLPLVLSKSDLKLGDVQLQKLSKRMNIEHLLNSFPNEMSGGERQRVAIARAMIHNPKIIMLDEPTGSLDSKSAEEVMNILKEINEKDGVTVIQVTHSERFCEWGNRIIRISDGAII